MSEKLMTPAQRAGQGNCYWSGPEVVALIERDRADILAKASPLAFRRDADQVSVMVVRLDALASLIEGR